MAKKLVQKTAAKPRVLSPELPLTIKHRLTNRSKAFLARRPHRSFRITRRRDYKRSLKLPGYIGLTVIVMKQFWMLRRQFLYLLLFYSLMTALFSTIVSQDTYRQVYGSVNSSFEGVANGSFSEIVKAGILLMGAVGGSLSGTSSELQQAYTVAIGLFTWLITIWLLRAELAGSKVKFRDALYSSGAPIIATMFVAILVLIQLVPAALGIVGYQTLVASGLASAGVLAMLVAITALILVLLTVYWLSSSLFAFVIVTLPGVYPMQAIRTAGDLVVSRRLRVLLRILWMVLCIVIVWAVVMIPFVIGVNALQNHITWLASVPIIPVAVIVMTALTSIFVSTYIYVFYRKIVDDDAAPA